MVDVAVLEWLESVLKVLSNVIDFIILFYSVTDLI